MEPRAYGVYRNDDDSLTDTVTISQNEAGIDTEDRIIKLKKYIANMKLYFYTFWPDDR